MKLNFCASVIYDGRVFSHRIIDTINLLKESKHKIKFSNSIKADIVSWHFMTSFNGRSMLLDKQPVTSVFTDSCNLGAGAIYNDHWLYTNWQRDWAIVTYNHINPKKILAVFLAVFRWVPTSENKRIYIQTNNVTLEATINRCTSANPFIMSRLITLFRLSATSNIRATASHLPKLSNTVEDDIFRTHERSSVKGCTLRLSVPFVFSHFSGQLLLSF